MLDSESKSTHIYPIKKTIIEKYLTNCIHLEMAIYTPYIEVEVVTPVPTAPSFSIQ